MNFNKNVLIGIVVGVVLTLVVQWGWSAYDARQMKESSQAAITAFNDGYAQAADKNAYVASYFQSHPLASSNAKVGISTSSADEGEVDGSYCQELGEYFDTLNQYNKENCLGPERWGSNLEKCDLVQEYWNQALEYAREENCTYSNMQRD